MPAYGMGPKLGQPLVGHSFKICSIFILAFLLDKNQTFMKKEIKSTRKVNCVGKAEVKSPLDYCKIKCDYLQQNLMALSGDVCDIFRYNT